MQLAQSCLMGVPQCPQRLSPLFLSISSPVLSVTFHLLIFLIIIHHSSCLPSVSSRSLSPFLLPSLSHPAVQIQAYPSVAALTGKVNNHRNRFYCYYCFCRAVVSVLSVSKSQLLFQQGSRQAANLPYVMLIHICCFCFSFWPSRRGKSGSEFGGPADKSHAVTVWGLFYILI